MSGTGQTFLFFMKCPDLKNLLSFTAEVVYDNQKCILSFFHRRILKCRELVFSDPDVIATPSNSSKNQITAVILKKKFYSTEFQQKLERMKLKISEIHDAFPAHLQECLQYTVAAKLAPQWNSVQNLLVQGRDFLIVSDPLRAVKLDIYVNDNEITLTVIPTCIRLPQFKIENYLKMCEFSGNNISIEEECHVLPSLKVGRATLLSRSLLSTSVFRNYADIKKHWKNMYGYRLPEIPEQNVWYMNVTFNVPFSPTYSYPTFCVRPFGMTEVPRIDPQPTLHSFISDFCRKVNNVCSEKCKLLDLKASFPTAKLHLAHDVTEGTYPKLGTSYTMVQNMPYRSSTASRSDSEKWDSKMKQIESASVGRSQIGRSPQIGRSSTVRGNELNISAINAPENSKSKGSAPSRHAMSHTDNYTDKKQCVKTISPGENQRQYQLGYNSSQNKNAVADNQSCNKTKVLVKSCDLSTSSTLDNSGSDKLSSIHFNNPLQEMHFNNNKNAETKYAPKFFPKKPKQEMKILKLTDLFTKVKSTKYIPNFAVGRKSGGSMQRPSAPDSNSMLSHHDSRSNINEPEISEDVGGKSITPKKSSKIPFQSRKSKKPSKDSTDMYQGEIGIKVNASSGARKDKKISKISARKTTKG